MERQGLTFRVAMLAVAVFGGSALAGCCGGPFSASDDDCTGDGDGPKPCGDGSVTPDGAACTKLDASGD